MKRNGFTMVEVIISIVVLSVAVLAISSSASHLAQVSADAERRALALQAVEDRLALVHLHPIYPQLDSIYTESSSTIPGLPGYTRNTAISRIIQQGEGGKSIDFTRITVTVDGPQLSTPLKRTVVIGAS